MHTKTGKVCTQKSNENSTKKEAIAEAVKQVIENAELRMQAGRDAKGDFTFSLFDATGKGVLIDATGIKPGAIANGLIVNDMVADNAAISGDKLDITSVIQSINGRPRTYRGWYRRV